MASDDVAFLITDERKRLIEARYLDIEWYDDVTRLRCVRCDRVAISHYVSNCQHLYCRNCRTIFSDGGRWKCLRCQEYVTELNDQHMDIERKLSQTRVYCPNKKYGCQQLDQLRNIVDHVKACINTKESALPMEYKGTNTMDLLYRHVSDLRVQLREMSDEMRVVKSESEANWKMMQARINELEQKVNSLTDQLTRHSKEFKTDFDSLNEKLTKSKMQLKGGDSDMQNKQMIENLKEKMKTVKSEQKMLLLKSIESLEKIHSIKVKNDEAIQGIVTKFEKVKPRLKFLETSLSSVINDRESDLRQMETNISGITRDIQQQVDRLNSVEQQIIDERKPENTSQLNMAEQEQTELWSKVEQHETSLKTELKDMGIKQSRLETKMKELTTQPFLFKAYLFVTIICLASYHYWHIQTITHMDSQIKNITTMNVQDKQLTLEIINTLKEQLNEVQLILQRRPKVDPAQVSDEDVRAISEVYTWNVEDTENKLSETKILHSEVFPLPGYQYGAKAKLELQKQSIYISLQLIESKNTKRPIDTKATPKVTYIIKDQSDGVEKRDIVRTTDCYFNQTIEYEVEIYRSVSVDLAMFNSPAYLKDNHIKIKILIEPPSVAKGLFSNDGVLLWRVSNYEQRKHMSIDESVPYHESPYFYTSPQGYRMQMRLHLNHYNGVRIYVDFLRGEYDSSLASKFPHRMTVTLFNQENPSNDLVRSRLADGTYWPDVYLESLSVLESNGYVKDDSLLFKVVVEPLTARELLRAK